MRPTFGRAYIEEEIRRIANHLPIPITVYLIGGGAMALRDLKAATKDLDLIVADGDEYEQLWGALIDLGYSEVKSLADEYQELGATSCVENHDGCRVDIFNQQVGNKLILTDGMCDRSEPFLATDGLIVRLVANEDIFLFKLVAGREDDIEDMNMLVQAGLDYEVIQAELEEQIDRLGDDQFVTFTNEALIALDERYGVTTPIEDHIKALTTRYYRGLEVLLAVEEPVTIHNLAEILGMDERTVQERVEYLEEFDRIMREGDTIFPSE